jgi:hypothetical protein
MAYSWPPFLERRHALEHIALVAELPPTQPGGAKRSVDVKASDMLAWLYAVLTTLDGKASALMRLNGVLIAAAAFLLGLFRRQGGTILSLTDFDARLIVVSALLSAISIFCCLWVVNVSWSFLGRVKKKGEVFDCTEELTHLDRACTFRQRTYRAAWWISLFSVLAFLVEFLIQATHVLFA